MAGGQCCSHPCAQTEPSRWADRAGYHRATPIQRAAAATIHGQTKRVPIPFQGVDGATFPAPLVLPEDDLAWDPKWPKQSLRSWIREKDRNAVTDTRNVVYIASPPRVAQGSEFIRSWASPRGSRPHRASADALTTPMVKYLTAFFWGLPVKRLDRPLKFVPWEESSSKRPTYIGLETGTERIGIRTRPCPDQSFSRQLSVSDLVDAVIATLPDDAYALLLVVDHDIYESDDDDYICGRAYGGSRAAVVSTARYNPEFDAALKLDLHHAWPSSHCQSFIEGQLLDATGSTSAQPLEVIDLTEESSPLQNAMNAYRRCLSQQAESADGLHGLWLSRVCRTASHELGHCFGMDHCVYYACNMQGTAGMAEDIRQPPYLCPVCQAKLAQATGEKPEARHTALLAYCETMEQVPTFAAYAAWLRSL